MECSVGYRGAVCGDEAIVPHTSGRCMGLRQYIARKPHATGIKLYVLADEKTTMWEFQLDILKRRYFAQPEASAARPESVVHAPVRHTQRKLCTYCGEGRTHWACAAMHITCFGPAHDVE